MIRWYDYIAAIVVAHTLFTIATGLFVEEIWWKLAWDALALTGWIIIWDEYYTKFRLKQETK